MPTFASTHTDTLLTRFSRQYPLGSGFVGLSILPEVPVGKESGLYFRYNKGDQARIPYTKRALRTESRRVTWRVDTNSFKCEEYALNDLIDDREYQQADSPLNLQRDTVDNLQRLMRLDREKRIYDIVSNTSNLTKNTTLTGTNQWRDAAASGATATPLEDFETGAESIRSDTGLKPNLAVFGQAAWLAFIKTDEVIDKMTTPGGAWGGPVITEAMALTLMAPYGITQVLVADQIQNTAGQGVTDSFSDVWADEVLLAFVNPRPGLKSVTLGLTFLSRRWEVRRAREDKAHSDWFEPSYVADEHLVAADVGYLIKDVSDGT